MKITVDDELCDGFGLCDGHAPDLFELDEDGYATARGDGTVPVDREPHARRAIAGCPAHAIVEVA